MSSIPKPAARNRHRKLAFHPHPFSLACTLWVALPHQPRFVTFSLLMVLSSYHLTGKLIPVFDYCQPQHNDPYPSPLVLLKLLFNGIGCQDKVIILFLNFWFEFLSCNKFTFTQFYEVLSNQNTQRLGLFLLYNCNWHCWFHTGFCTAFISIYLWSL